MIHHKTKIVGIVNKLHELAHVIRVLESIEGGQVERLLVVGDGTIADLVPEHIPVKLLSEYTSGEDIQKKAVIWLDDWSENSLMDGHSFKELFSYQDLSLFGGFFCQLSFPILCAVCSI